MKDKSSLNLRTHFKVLSEVFRDHIFCSGQTRLLSITFVLVTFLSKYLEILSIKAASNIQTDFDKLNSSGKAGRALYYVIMNLLFFTLNEGLSFAFSGPIQRSSRVVVRNGVASALSLSHSAFQKIGASYLYTIIERKGLAVFDILDVALLEVFPAIVATVFYSVFLADGLGVMIPCLMAFFNGIFLYSTFWITKKRTAIRKRLNERTNELCQALYDTLLNADTVRCYSGKFAEIQKIDKALTKVESRNVALFRSLFVLNLVQRVIFLAQMIIIMSLGAYGILTDAFDGSMLQTYLGFARSLGIYLFKSGYLYGRYTIGVLNYTTSTIPGIYEPTYKEYNERSSVNKNNKDDLDNKKPDENIKEPSQKSDITISSTGSNLKVFSEEDQLNQKSAVEILIEPSYNLSLKNFNDTTQDFNKEDCDLEDSKISSTQNGSIKPTCKNEHCNTRTDLNTSNHQNRDDLMFEREGGQILDSIQYGISASGLGVYFGNRIVLKNLAFNFTVGTKIAVVGRNGIGKSTLLKTMLGFNPYEGNIYFDNKELRQLSLESIRNKIAYIHQDAGIFNETIRYNIAYGNFEATDSEIIQACKEIGIHESIERLSEGYYTLAGERGSNLSGGERQKIAFARAHMKKQAKIVMLDEPTASLDKDAEADILDSLFRMATGKTIFMILHNLDLLGQFDQILFLSENRSQSGTLNELLQSNRDFEAFYSQRQS